MVSFEQFTTVFQQAVTKDPKGTLSLMLACGKASLEATAKLKSLMMSYLTNDISAAEKKEILDKLSASSKAQHGFNVLKQKSKLLGELRLKRVSKKARAEIAASFMKELELFCGQMDEVHDLPIWFEAKCAELERRFSDKKKTSKTILKVLKWLAIIGSGIAIVIITIHFIPAIPFVLPAAGVAAATTGAFAGAGVALCADYVLRKLDEIKDTAEMRDLKQNADALNQVIIDMVGLERYKGLSITSVLELVGGQIIEEGPEQDAFLESDEWVNVPLIM